jgi:hypothetical protein
MWWPSCRPARCPSKMRMIFFLSYFELFMFSLISCYHTRTTWGVMVTIFMHGPSKVEIYRTSPFIKLCHIKLHHSWTKSMKIHNLALLHGTDLQSVRLTFHGAVTYVNYWRHRRPSRPTQLCHAM